MSSSAPPFVVLTGSTNYNQWYTSVHGLLLFHRVLDQIIGVIAPPPTDPNLLYRYNEAAQRAAGTIFGSVAPEIQAGISFTATPRAMMAHLATRYATSSSGGRFNALTRLVSISMEEDEKVDAWIQRLDDASRNFISSCPTGYSLMDMRNDMIVTALLHRANSKLAHVVPALLAQENLTRDHAQNSLRNEEARQLATTQVAALRAAAEAAARLAAADSNCAFCLRPGHDEGNCFKKRDAMKLAQEQVSSSSSSKPGNRRKRQAARKAAASEESEEYAGAASRISSSPSTLSHSDHWLADTGATASMTPHREWFQDYKPCLVRVRTANGSTLR